MNKINHHLTIPKNLKIRFSKDIIFMKSMGELLNGDFYDYSFERCLSYLRIQTKLPLTFLRKKLLDVYRELGIVIEFNNTIPKK